jgi:hypothetical protein
VDRRPQQGRLDDLAPLQRFGQRAAVEAFEP